MGDIAVLFKHSKGTINPNIFGHFSEHIGGVFYDGIWVGEDSPVENIHGLRKALVDSFARLNPPVLRWPGGCFAETYDWRDGIGPRSERPVRLNWWYLNDHRTESNQVGTHEFMEFCELTGAQPYVAANMTSVTALHIRDWVEYCNMPEGLTTLARERANNGHPAPFNVRYWGIGNENWGGGGSMTADMCAREYLRFATLAYNVPGDITCVACGPSGHDIAWTRELMATIARKGTVPKALSVHYYCGTAGTPQEFTEEQWYQLLHQANYMQNVVDDNRAAMDEYDPSRQTAMFVDEWGCWHQDGTGPSQGYNLFEQQSNMRDAVVAALTLNIFIDRCDVVAMANVAQLCNNLHSLYLASGDKFVETPNYHVYDLYKTHQNARQLMLANDCGVIGGGEAFRDNAKPLDKVSAAASVSDSGLLTITLANTSMTEPAQVTLRGVGGTVAGTGDMLTLCSADPHTCNTFDNPTAVTPTVQPIALSEGGTITLPPASVTALRIQH